MSNRRDFFKALFAAPLAAPTLFAKSEATVAEPVVGTISPPLTIGSSEPITFMCCSTASSEIFQVKLATRDKAFK